MKERRITIVNDWKLLSIDGWEGIPTSFPFFIFGIFRVDISLGRVSLFCFAIELGRLGGYFVRLVVLGFGVCILLG